MFLQDVRPSDTASTTTALPEVWNSRRDDRVSEGYTLRKTNNTRDESLSQISPRYREWCAPGAYLDFSFSTPP